MSGRLGEAMNKRRKILVALGASALAVPFGVIAQQQGKVWRIGFLWESGQSDLDSVQKYEAFKAGMFALGYVEGKNIAFEHRSAQNDPARLSPLAAELLAAKVDLIVSTGTPSAEAARKLTRELPILITTAGNPVGSGLAASLRRPGGNVTGMTNLASDLYTKRLDLLRQTLPRMRHVGFLYNPRNSSDMLGLKQFESQCKSLGLQAIRAPVLGEQEISVAFQNLKRNKAEGLLVTSDAIITSWRKSIIENAAKYRLPAVYGTGIMTSSGGLMAYSANREDLYRRAAAYADKIFKGAKPGDLPIEQPNKFEMVINLKTAKALGIKIPDIVMLRAEKVIE